LGTEELWRRARWTFTEEHYEQVQDKLIYLSGDMKMVPKLKLDNNFWAKEFAKLVKDERPNVIMLDPISNFMEGDDSNASSVMKLFDNIDSMIADNPELNLSFIISHHFKKPPAVNFQDTWDPLDAYNFRGSSKWKDYPDTLVTMCRVGAGSLDANKGWNLKVKLEARKGQLPVSNVFLAVRPETENQVFRLSDDNDRPISRIAVL
jgi:hypothetical protein